MLSTLALRHKGSIFKRNKSIIDKNRAVLDKWIRETPEAEYIRPVAGTTALVYYAKEIPSREFAVRLLKEKGVLVTPGECFDMEGSIRIGYAYDSKRLQTGLDKIAELLREI